MERRENLLLNILILVVLFLLFCFSLFLKYKNKNNPNGENPGKWQLRIVNALPIVTILLIFALLDNIYIFFAEKNIQLVASNYSNPEIIQVLISLSAICVAIYIYLMQSELTEKIEKSNEAAQSVRDAAHIAEIEQQRTFEIYSLCSKQKLYNEGQKSILKNQFSTLLSKYQIYTENGEIYLFFPANCLSWYIDMNSGDDTSEDIEKSTSIEINYGSKVLVSKKIKSDYSGIEIKFEKCSDFTVFVNDLIRKALPKETMVKINGIYIGNSGIIEDKTDFNNMFKKKEKIAAKSAPKDDVSDGTPEAVSENSTFMYNIDVFEMKRKICATFKFEPFDVFSFRKGRAIILASGRVVAEEIDFID